MKAKNQLEKTLSSAFLLTSLSLLADPALAAIRPETSENANSPESFSEPLLSVAPQSIPLHPISQSAVLESGLDPLLPLTRDAQPQVQNLLGSLPLQSLEITLEAENSAPSQSQVPVHHLMGSLPAREKEEDTGVEETSTRRDVRNAVENTDSVDSAKSNGENRASVGRETPILILSEEVPVEADPMGQVNNVFDLRDVNPGDWAYQALSDLIQRYNCIAGYPDGTFRGDRAMTRYEFAAGLNACLQQMERILAEATSDLATREDLEILQRLMREFEAELATVATRVDNLEARVTFLEDNQFSTTTKLFGQAIIGLAGRSADNNFTLAAQNFIDQDNEIALFHNVQLSLFTQFSPRSLLLTSMQAGDGSTTSAGSATRSPTRSLFNYVGLGFEGDSNNDLSLSDLNYRHLIGNNFALMVGPLGISPVNVFRGTNRVESAGSGPISRFAQRNPILGIGNGSSGIGFDWQVLPNLSLQGVYSADSLANGIFGGLFGGDFATTTFGLQTVVSPSDNIDLSFQYIHSYSPFGFLGTAIGDDRQILGNNANARAPMNTDAFGFGMEWRIIPEVTFGSWVGYTASDYQVGEGIIETLNWMTFLNFNDLGGEGNLLGLYFGQPPRIISSTLPGGNLAAGIQARNVPSFFSNGEILTAPGGGQPGKTYHLEAFYRIQVTDNISITPGAIVVFNPLQNSANDTIVIGALRTTFTF